MESANKKLFYSTKAHEMEMHKNNNVSNIVFYTDRGLKSLYRFLSWIGFVSGVFPVKNFWNWNRWNDLSFKKLSFPVLWSLILFAVKLYLIFVIFGVIAQFESSAPGLKNQKFLDLLAGGLSFALTYALGIIVHFICLYNTPTILKNYQDIENYDKLYMKEITVKLFSFKVLFSNSISWYFIFSPISLFWNIISNGSKKIVFLIGIPGVWFYITTDQMIACILCIICIAVIEWGVLFLFAQIYALSHAISARLEMIIEKAESISKVESINISFIIHNHFHYKNKYYNGKQMSSNCRNREDLCWYKLTKEYLDFHTLFKNFEESIGPIFIFLFLSLISASIGMIFYKMNTNGRLAEEVPHLLFLAIAFSLYRLYALADCGEKISKRYTEFKSFLIYVNQEESFQPDEEAEFKKLLTIVETLPITLSAGGYFTISRNCVTHILGVIITYIVVLIQFRNTPGTQSASLAEVMDMNFDNVSNSNPNIDRF